jgi:hypothetical protein
MFDRLERVTNPMDAQRAAFDRLKEAAGKAADIVRAACPTDRPITPPGRLAAAEKWLTALLEAVKTVRPAMDAFYATLSDEQKARLYIDRVRPWHFDGGRDERGWDRRFDDTRGERRDRGADRQRSDNDDRPRRDWRDGRRDDRPRHNPRDYDRDGWADDWRGGL